MGNRNNFIELTVNVNIGPNKEKEHANSKQHHLVELSTITMKIYRHYLYYHNVTKMQSYIFNKALQLLSEISNVIFMFRNVSLVYRQKSVLFMCPIELGTFTSAFTQKLWLKSLHFVPGKAAKSGSSQNCQEQKQY